MRFKSLAVIGSSGMVGSDLVQYLKPNFAKISEIERKNYDKHRGQFFDVVINANGNSNKPWANEHIFDDFEASTVSVYKTLVDFPCDIYIYISSADVYENHTSKKTTSESESINPEILSPYGLHKYLSEYIVRNVKKKYIILRCPMILGAKLKKGPIYDILENSKIFASEQSAFQIITTKEISQIIHFLIDKDITKETFNIGGGGTVALSKVRSYVQKPINFPKDGKIQTYETNVSKLNKIYPLKTSAQYLKEFLNKYILKP